MDLAAVLDDTILIKILFMDWKVTYDKKYSFAHI